MPLVRTPILTALPPAYRQIYGSIAYIAYRASPTGLVVYCTQRSLSRKLSRRIQFTAVIRLLCIKTRGEKICLTQASADCTMA
eukprot:6204193-Pleurochrysis_carterae.AAC.1